MGVVYKARDTKLDRDVALKFLPPDLTSDPEAKERFIQEAKAASALEHPNICNVHEIGETEEGKSFIVMACYTGETLKNKIQRGRLRLEEALDIAIQTVQGLSRAHEAGIVHRDIKPANIILTDRGEVKILDFGLAKLAGYGKLTKTRSTAGTAAYMSPEQIQGGEVDARSDIFSFGTTLYEMLTGHSPFRGDHEVALSYSIVNEAPLPVKEWHVEIPAALDKITGRCMEKNREKRYQSADDLAKDLQTLRQEIVPGIKVQKRGAKLAFLVVGLVVIAGLALLAYFLHTPKSTVLYENSIAVLPFVDMSPQKDQEYFCDGITEELINRLSNVKELRVPARTSVFTFKGKTGDIREIGNKLHVKLVLEGSIRKADDQLRITAQLINIEDGYHLWSETYNRKLKDVFSIQDEISLAIVNALKLKLTSPEKTRITDHPIGNLNAYESYLKAMRQLFRFDEKSVDTAITFLQDGIEIMGDNALFYAGLARAYSQKVNIGAGQEDDFEKASNYADKALALNPDLPDALQIRGLLLSYQKYPKNLQDDFVYLKRALALNPNQISAVEGLSSIYMMIGKPAKALEMLEKCENLDPLNPMRNLYRGYYYLYNCEYKPALEQLDKYYESDPGSPLAILAYTWALACNNRNEDAIAVINRDIVGETKNILSINALLFKYALGKDRKNAMRVMTPEFQKTCRRDFEWSYYVASRLSLLGANDEALDWLENAVSCGFLAYSYLECDPFLENIRGDERYKKLLEHAKYEWENFKEPE